MTRIDSGHLRDVAKRERDSALSAAAVRRARTNPASDDYVAVLLAYNDERHAAWQTYLVTVMAIADGAA